jgi:hypothetical protein
MKNCFLSTHHTALIVGTDGCWLYTLHSGLHLGVGTTAHVIHQPKVFNHSCMSGCELCDFVTFMHFPQSKLFQTLLGVLCNSDQKGTKCENYMKDGLNGEDREKVLNIPYKLCGC